MARRIRNKTYAKPIDGSKTKYDDYTRFRRNTIDDFVNRHQHSPIEDAFRELFGENWNKRNQKEKQADELADKAVSSNGSTGTNLVSQEPNLQKSAKDEEPIKSSSLNNSALESKIKFSQGKPLELNDRKYFEDRFGTSFSSVKVHTSPTAEHLAKAIHARAFTVRNDIFFGKGEFSPNTTEGKKLIAHELTHTLQQNSTGEAQLQRYILPTDWLDYIGLGIDIAERIYIELAYKEGEEKDFQRFVNNLYLALDIVMAALPGAGGGGLAFRASHSLAVAGWGALPSSAQLKVSEQVAKALGWTLTRTTQMINRFFSAVKDGDNESSNERRDVASHDSAGGHTYDRHVGKSENWLKQRLKNNPDLDFASSFSSLTQANRAQGQFVKKFKKAIDAWLKSGDSVFKGEIMMNNIIGYVIKRENGQAIATRKVFFVIAKDNSLTGWHFVTSFPKL